LDAGVDEEHDVMGPNGHPATVHVDRRGVNAADPTIPANLRKLGVRGFAGTVHDVDVRIGVTQAPREISVEVDDRERDDVKAKVEAALAGAADVLWLTDKRGRDIGVPAAKIAYVEVGTADGDRRIGFGG
jgi:hypothetical protein